MRQDGKFGDFLLEAGYVGPHDLGDARNYQRRCPFMRIGEILVGERKLSLQTLVLALRIYRSKLRIGELLMSEGLITEEQLEAALQQQKETGLMIGKILIDLGACTMSQVMRALAMQRQASDELAVG